MMSDVSSLNDDGDIDLLNPATRKYKNDIDYLKYVRIQMWWNFLTAGFLGLYSGFLATLASIKNMPYLKIDCLDGE